MDPFLAKSITPMLIGLDGEPFDSPDYIYELKLDGVRCLAYLDSSGAEFRNKRNLRVSAIYPELSSIHRQAKERCILDGELIVMHQGKPDFEEMKRRSLMSNRLKIGLSAEKLPVTFTCFDILYYQDRLITELPLMERKSILQGNINESGSIAVSRYIEQNGFSFFKLAEENDLEGIVAKRRDSRYYCGSRTKDWIKIKNLKDDDYIVSGYIQKSEGITSIILGQYRGKTLIYKGHVTLGVSGGSYQKIASLPRLSSHPFLALPTGNETAVWVEPVLVCTVKYMTKSESGSLRQPVFKGLREDKLPEECVE